MIQRISLRILPTVDADKLFNLAPGEVYGPYVREILLHF
jgi:hypothetical protein